MPQLRNRRDIVDVDCPRCFRMVPNRQGGANMYMTAWTRTHHAKELFAVPPLDSPLRLSRAFGTKTVGPRAEHFASASAVIRTALVLVYDGARGW